MVALPEVKNVEDCANVGGGNVLIPEGKYQAVIVDSDLKDTSNKKGKFLALTVIITQGQYANTEFVERLNIINENAKAVEIAYGVLGSISKALGMSKTPADSNELHNKPIIIEIVNKKQDDWTNDKGETVEGKEKSEIKRYHAMPASGVAPVNEAAPAPTQEPVQAEVTAPSTNPFAS